MILHFSHGLASTFTRQSEVSGAARTSHRPRPSRRPHPSSKRAGPPATPVKLLSAHNSGRISLSVDEKGGGICGGTPAAAGTINVDESPSRTGSRLITVAAPTQPPRTLGPQGPRTLAVEGPVCERGSPSPRRLSRAPSHSRGSTKESTPLHPNVPCPLSRPLSTSSGPAAAALALRRRSLGHPRPRCSPRAPWPGGYFSFAFCLGLTTHEGVGGGRNPCPSRGPRRTVTCAPVGPGGGFLLALERHVEPLGDFLTGAAPRLCRTPAFSWGKR